MKTAKQLERYFKGASNHRRLEIVLLLSKTDGMTLEQIVESLDCNMKTVSGHTGKLLQAGLLSKKYKGQAVIHSLSPYGKMFAGFAKKF